MEQSEERASRDALAMTSEIVSAYASRNQMAREALPDLIRSVHEMLHGLASGGGLAPAEDTLPATPLTPAVPIDASVTPDAIICLEDGKAIKTLKRHLRTAFDMSPAEYRAKWGLSKDYPMVAPSYRKRRSKTAKEIGLGQRPGKRTKKS